MMGIGTNSPMGTNMLSRALFFDQQLDPATPWFTIVDPDTPGIFPFGGAVCGDEKFAVGISLMVEDFEFSDVYGVMVDSAAPEITGFDVQGTTVDLSFTSLFTSAHEPEHARARTSGTGVRTCARVSYRSILRQ